MRVWNTCENKKEMTDFRGRAFALTKETVNDPDDNGFNIASQAIRILCKCRPSEYPDHVEILHYVLSLKPDLFVFYNEGTCILGDLLKTQICLSYGYRFPHLIFPHLIPTTLSNVYYIVTAKSIFTPSFRLLFEHGTLCPPEKYRKQFPWVFDLYNQVVMRRENCAQAYIALLASARTRIHKDVLPIVMKRLWETRREDAWLK